MRMTVQNAINSLDKDEQIVLQLGVFEDKTIHQIAKELNMSKSAVGRLKLSAQDKLKKMLEKEVMFVENWDILAKSDEARENNPVEIV